MHQRNHTKGPSLLDLTLIRSYAFVIIYNSMGIVNRDLTEGGVKLKFTPPLSHEASPSSLLWPAGATCCMCPAPSPPLGLTCCSYGCPPLSQLLPSFAFHVICFTNHVLSPYLKSLMCHANLYSLLGLAAWAWSIQGFSKILESKQVRLLFSPFRGIYL